METVHSLQSDLAYFKQLVGAGLDGVTSARNEMRGDLFKLPLQALLPTPAAVGACLAILTTGAVRSRRSTSDVAMSGLVGTVLGLGVALVWASRHFTGLADRRALCHVNAARDAHWLESHPIDYA